MKGKGMCNKLLNGQSKCDILWYGLQYHLSSLCFITVHYREANPVVDLTKNDRMESTSLSVQPSKEIASTSKNYKNRLRRHTDTFDTASRFEDCDNRLLKFSNSENDTDQGFDKETPCPTSLPSTQSIDIDSDRHENKESLSPVGPQLSDRPRIKYNSKDKVCVYTPLCNLRMDNFIVHQ